MDTHFVFATFNLTCTWQGEPPVYRVYLNNELFTERKWLWAQENIIEQILQIQAPAGEYMLKIEPAYPSHANFSIRNNHVMHGPAVWQEQNKLVVQS